MSTLKSIEQGRVSFAYQCAQQIVSLDSVEKRIEYRDSVELLPSLIRERGLGHALKYLTHKVQSETNRTSNESILNMINPLKESQSIRSAYHLIYMQIDRWLHKNINHLIPEWSQDNLADQVLKLNTCHYQIISTEIMTLLSWLRSYAAILVEEN